MKTHAKRQYTIRNIPASIDLVLHVKDDECGKEISSL